MSPGLRFDTSPLRAKIQAVEIPGQMDMVPCWITTVSGCIIIPLSSLTRSSHGAREGEPDDENQVQSYNPGKGVHDSLHNIPTYIVLLADPAGMFTIGTPP